MGKRKLADGDDYVPTGKRPSKIAKSEVTYKWSEKDWIEDKAFKKNVMRMIPKPGYENAAPFPSVVKKIEKSGRSRNPSGEYEKPRELLLLQKIRRNNRIVEPFYTEYNDENENWTMIFEEHKLGSLVNWRTQEFRDVNAPAPVPEVHLWRFLVNMAQALSVIHNQNGWAQKSRGKLIHRDIKPDNILVASNGTGYPSFMLHDFGLSEMVYSHEDEQRRSYCGSYSWQPPENPLINTPAADVWAVGACLHFLAFGDYLIDKHTDDWLENTYPPKMRRRVEERADHYRLEGQWYRANALRKINSIDKGYLSSTQNPCPAGPSRNYRPNYSSRLDYWMKQALDFEPANRVTVERLMNSMVPEARAKLQELGGDRALENLDLVFYD